MSTGAVQQVVPVPEPELTPDEMVARAEALRPLLYDEQAATEERGYHSEQIHEAFLEAGFYRCLQPRRFGGYEFDVPTFCRVIMEVARGCPSTGWCLCLASGHALQLASFYAERAQAEAFGPDGDFRSPAVGAPTGTAVRVDGGWLVDGTWNYCSGVPYATHFMPVVRVPGERPGDPEGLALAVVPRSGWTMLDDWGEILGLRGSGSHSIVIEEALVPEDFLAFVNLPDIDVTGGTIGSRLHGNPMYACRVCGFFHAELVSIVVGTARAALDEFEQIIRTRTTLLPPIMPRYRHHDFQRPLGLALGMVDAAEAVLVNTAERIMQCARGEIEEGTPFTLEDDLRLFARLEHAGRLASEAVELLFRAAGSNAAKNGQRMQRYYRDISIYRSHFSAQYESWGQDLARVHLGLEPTWNDAG